MDYESNHLLTLLRCFVLGERPQPYEGDWEKLAQLAATHSIIGILGYMTMTYPDICAPSARPMLRGACMNTLTMQAKRAAAMGRLITGMEGEGIDHLVFKGYVVRNYYPVPELRTFGDIDFLIRPADRERSDALMMAQDFVRETDWEPVYSYLKQAEYYEIHTDMMEVDVSQKADYKGYFGGVWEHAVQTGPHTYELTPEFHFLYLLTHIAKHISSSGAGIRMYLDIAFFLRRFGDGLDWGWVAGELEKLAFTGFANMVLTVVERYLRVESPLPLAAVEPQVLEDFMAFTMDGGVFGHVGRDQGLVELKKQSQGEENISRTKTMVTRLFPSADSIESRYTYLQGRHWLLPVAWVHRLARTREDWGSHAREAQSILNTDSEEVLRLRRVYRALGL